MKKLAVIVLLSVLVGCTVTPSPSPLSPSPLSPSSPLEPQWSWGVVPVKVVPFDNKTPIKVTQRSRKRLITRKPLERGITQQLVRMLEQSKAFTVIGRLAMPDETKAQNHERQTGAEGEGSSMEASGETQLELSGDLNAYDLSPASVADGVSEDPLLHGLQDDPVAENAFALLAKNAKKIDQDLISFDVRLMDAKTSNEIAHTSLQCTAKDWEESIEGWFGKQLHESIPPPRTPIQQATQVCLIKAVNWVGDWYDLWRKNPERFPNYREIQKDLNTLGYNCGPVDGIRGARTETCIQEFLAKTGTEEKDLEKRIEEEVTKLPVPSVVFPKPTHRVVETPPSPRVEKDKTPDDGKKTDQVSHKDDGSQRQSSPPPEPPSAPPPESGTKDLPEFE